MTSTPDEMPPSMSGEDIDRGPQDAVAWTQEHLSNRLTTQSNQSPVPSSLGEHPSSPTHISGSAHELGHAFNGQELQELGDTLDSGGQTSCVDPGITTAKGTSDNELSDDAERDEFRLKEHQAANRPDSSQHETTSLSIPVLGIQSDGTNLAGAGDESARPIQDPRIGLNWTVSGYDASVHWNRQPSVPSIISVLEQVLDSDEIRHIEPTWDGLYNKFYTVHCGENKKYVMKLTLPVCPRTKTESEVATIRWTLANTNLQGAMPEVVAYSSSPDNPTGCEWMLMKHLIGKPLSECWKDVSLEAKERIVLVLAKYAQCVYETKFKQIGSIYPAPLPSRGKRYQVGKISSPRFFWDQGAQIEPNQGPFSSTKEWSQRRLNLANEHLWLRFVSIQHGPEKERQRIWRLINMSGVESRLWRLYDHLFPPEEEVDDEDGHTIEAIGRPILVDGSISLGSVQASELSNQDELEDGEIRGENEVDEATLSTTHRRGAYGSRMDSIIEPSIYQHAGHCAIEHQTPDRQIQTSSRASSPSTLDG